MNRISDDSKPETDSVLYVVGGTEEDRRSLGALLSRLGREVRNKSSAEELLETLTPARPFVLVSTISLPGMDGMALAQTLQDSGAAPAWCSWARSLAWCRSSSSSWSAWR